MFMPSDGLQIFPLTKIYIILFTNYYLKEPNASQICDGIFY